MLSFVISGGQTGVDQAALRAARTAGIPTGGFAPLGWSTEDGPAPWLHAPNLARLEKITLVKEMAPGDYREAWAWVHLMLNNTPQTRTVLLSYLQQLRHTKDPGPLEPHLRAVFSNPENILRQHVARLEADTRTLTAIP